MKAKEKAVRDAAAALNSAILEAREEGYHIDWPRRVEDLPFIAVSETARAHPVVQVAVPAGTDHDLTEKAAAAAQRAVDRVVDPPPKK